MEAKLSWGTTFRPSLEGVGSRHKKESSVPSHILEPDRCTCQARHVIGTERHLLQTIIPPWSISLVSLDLPTKFETVAIAKDVNCVSVETVQTLLRQIEGLTSLAQTRSLEARDMLMNLHNQHEKVVKQNLYEIASLRAHIEEKEGGLLGMSGHGKTRVEEGEEALGTCGKVSPPPIGKCVDHINCTVEIQSTLNPELHAPVQRQVGLCEVDNGTGFTSDSEEGTDVDEDSNLDIGGFTTVVQTNMAKFGVSSFVDSYSSDDVTKKRKHILVSDGPANIIYGRPKMTRSG